MPRRPLPDRRFHLASRLLPLALAFALLQQPSAARAAPVSEAARLYEDALKRYEGNDMAGAAIQVKNALQKDPRLLAAHLLLGRTLLAQGKAMEAEQSLLTALRMGVDRSEIAPLLAQAYLDQGNPKRVLEQIDISGLPPRALFEVLLLRAGAQMDMGDLRGAERTLDEARRIDAGAANLHSTEAALRMRERNFPAAIQAADRAIAAAPKDARQWMTRGSARHGMNDAAGALADYGRAIALDADFGDARVARAGLLMDLNRDQEAWKDLEALRRQAAQDPRGAYLRALYHGRRNETEKVAAALADVVKVTEAIPADLLQRRPQYLLLAGLANHGLGQAEKARSYLRQFVLAEPRHVGARKLLASMLLAERDYAGALDMLQPAYKAGASDSTLLSLLASANLGLNRRATAAELLEQAAASATDPQTSASIGLTMLGTGQTEEALALLRKAVAGDPEQVQAATALAMLEMRQGNARAGIATARQLTRERPKDPIAHNLLGAALGAAGDLKEARTAYGKALELDPGFVTAHLNLAKLDLGEGKPEQARNRLAALLPQYPKHGSLLYELARAEWLLGQRDSALQRMEKLRTLEPRNFRAASELVDRYLETRAFDKALGVAKDMEAKTSGDHPVVLSALARAYTARSERGNARLVLDRLVRLAGFDAVQLTDAARQQLAAGLTDGARYTLEKALTGTPAQYLPAERLLAELELAGGDLGQADKRLRALRARAADDAEVLRLAGQLALARKQYPEAIRLFQDSHAKAPSATMAQTLANAHIAAGQPARGLEVLRAWSRSHPDDVDAVRAMAIAQLKANDRRGARATLAALLQKTPDDPRTLNNLAYIMIGDGDPKAVSIAEKAHRLAPDDPAVSDTLGWALLRQGQTEEALRHLREARLRAPGNGDIRYHLAEALGKAGRQAEARQEIKEALRIGLSAEYAEAARRLSVQLASAD